MLPLVAHSGKSVQLVDGGPAAVLEVNKHGRPRCEMTAVSTRETGLIPRQMGDSMLQIETLINIGHGIFGSPCLT